MGRDTFECRKAGRKGKRPPGWTPLIVITLEIKTVGETLGINRTETALYKVAIESLGNRNSH